MHKYIKPFRLCNKTLLSVILACMIMLPIHVYGYSSSPDTNAITAVKSAANIIGWELIAVNDSGPDSGFSRRIIKLSIEEAITRAQEDGINAESAELNKKADLATAAGYSEKLNTIADALEKYSDADINVSATLEAAGMTATNEKLFIIQSGFAKENIENNYAADMNKIISDTISAYYGTLQARENYIISLEAFEIENIVLSNMQKKYDLGMISKVTLIQAENSLIEASSNIESAKSTYKSARMGLNMLLGYNLIQNVELTSSLSKLEVPPENLEIAIEKAIGSRNEIKYVSYAMSLQEVMMNSIKVRYPSSSSTYKKQYASYLQTQLATQSVPEQIEIDIRSKYSNIIDKSEKLTTAENSVALAENAYKIATITYNSGLSVFTDLKKSELTLKRAHLGLMMATSEYNQAIYDYEFAQGVGMERILF